MTYDVWRIMEGDRASNADYVGTIEAESRFSAEDYARLMYGWKPGCERIEVEKQGEIERC